MQMLRFFSRTTSFVLTENDFRKSFPGRFGQNSVPSDFLFEGLAAHQSWPINQSDHSIFPVTRHTLQFHLHAAIASGTPRACKIAEPATSDNIL